MRVLRSRARLSASTERPPPVGAYSVLVVVLVGSSPVGGGLHKPMVRVILFPLQER